MHEEDVAGLVTKVLHADKIIHQQQLGWDWHPPAEGTLTGTLQLDEEPTEEEASRAEKLAWTAVAKAAMTPPWL